MLVNTRRKAIYDGLKMVATLATGGYPSFVFGRPLTGVPVFCFHEIEPVLFEQQLRFLKDNGYETLTHDEFYEVTSGGRVPLGRTVMITFDDGWGTLWSCGLPLLKRYGVKAVLYLATGRIGHGDLGPTLDDLQAGRCEPSAVLGRDTSENPFVTWNEVRALHASGLVDVQSHSLTHGRMFSSPKIEDFVRPALLRRLSITKLPEWTPDTSGGPAVGRPLYHSAPRISDLRHFKEDPTLRQACETHVAERGGAGFFDRPRWRRELTRWFERLRADRGDQGRFETDEEREAALWRELVESKRLIEQHLPGKIVRHFAYPWDNSCELAIRLSWRAGYVSNAVAQVDGKQMAIRQGQPTLFARLGCDWLFTLPGKGRHSVAKPLALKFGRGVVKPISVCHKTVDVMDSRQPVGGSSSSAVGGAST